MKNSTSYSSLLKDKEFEQIKNYLKVDHHYEDELIKEFLDAVALQVMDAISSKLSLCDFWCDPRFHLAVKKQAKEEYEHRGVSADTFRHEMANGVVNIIHQLRAKGVMEDVHS
jgi:uncharacterized phage protein (predicted DNA packaging)